MRSGVPAAAIAKARATIRRASSTLNALSPDGAASMSAACRCPAERVPVRARAGQGGLRSPGAPGLERDAAERDAGLGDPATLHPQRRRGRHDGEGVGRALPHLQVPGMGRELRRLGGQPHGDDQVARLQHGLALRRSAGRRWKSTSGTSTDAFADDVGFLDRELLENANISSCLRMVLAFSTPFSSANETSSAGVWALRS